MKSTVYAMSRPLNLPFVAPVNGISVRQDAALTVKEGDPVRITHDPANPHDSNACEIRTADGLVLGYLPAAVASRLAAGDADAWDGEIIEVLDGRETRGLRVRVTQPAVPVGATAQTTIVPRAAANHSSGAGSDNRAGSGRDGEARVVRAPSGRILGVLVSEDGETVVVTRDGRESSYPRRVVTIS